MSAVMGVGFKLDPEFGMFLGYPLLTEGENVGTATVT